MLLCLLPRQSVKVENLVTDRIDEVPGQMKDEFVPPILLRPIPVRTRPVTDPLLQILHCQRQVDQSDCNHLKIISDF